jgi:hypothetical protein
LPVSLESITQYVAKIRVQLDPNNDDSPAVVFQYKTNVITSDVIEELEQKAIEETERRERTAVAGAADELSIQDLFNRWVLKKVLVGWDITDAAGEPLPLTMDNLGKLDLFYRQRIYTAIRESLSIVDPTTKKRSSSS